MIRLTFNANLDPEIHLFNKSTILLGADPNLVDLTISDAGVQPIHLKIVEQNGFPILINHANDPFVSVNGHPFGKKLLNSGDVIIVNQTPILFENLKILANTETGQENESAAGEFGAIPSMQEPLKTAKENERPFDSFSLPFEAEVEALEEENPEAALQNYLKELDPSPVLKQTLSTPPESKKPVSLKDDYLKELEDDHQKEDSPFSDLSEPSHLYQAWKWILLFIFSLVSITAAIATIIYYSLSDKTEAQETKAAQAVADIAMALTHAHLSQAKPHNQNWSDIDFLKNNILAALPESPSYASKLDAHGQFNSCPYSLRIYTNSDLSHFLLIAQPAPSLLYWLIPQSIITVDSHLMELRTLKDIKSLNRLLANPDPLEGTNGRELTALVKQGNLIRLSNLASESGHLDFAPPKNLAWIRPGAENYIYNAPRYYKIGQRLAQKAIQLSTSKGSSKEVAALKQDVKNFEEFNHFIFYSDGKKSSLLMRQGLTVFAPSDKFLFGYLLFNANGKIHQAHLLKEEEEWKDSSLMNLGEAIAFQPPNDMPNKEELNKKNPDPDIDRNHPIFIQLQSLISAREIELKPMLAPLIELIRREFQNPCSRFQTEFQQLSHSYLMTNQKHKKIIRANLEDLYQQYQNVPTNTFLKFIKELNLEQLIQKVGEEIPLIDANCQENMEILLNQIENCKTLMELDNLTFTANTWLHFDYIEEPNELLKYQNLLRNQLLKQLEAFLINRTKPFTIKPEKRELLQLILSHERLIKPEEREFFLTEFEFLLASHYPAIAGEGIEQGP